MSAHLKRESFLKDFKSLHQNKIKFQAPLILRMYGALNEVNMRKENRYILCNFLDQHGDEIGLKENVYETNNDASLNQLLLFALDKARKNNLINALYEEYLNSIDAINRKKAI